MADAEKPAEPTGRPPFKPSLSQRYPLIDSDPHFMRVVRYMRPSDVAYGAGLAAAGPAIMWFNDWADPPYKPEVTRLVRLRGALRLAGLIGLTGGFMFAYIRSSKRFWGWDENAREVKKDWKEMTQRVKDGKPLYGFTELPEYMQGVAMRNSHYSQLKLAVMPWFNFVNHKYHGVDPAMYGTPPADTTKDAEGGSSTDSA